MTLACSRFSSISLHNESLLELRPVFGKVHRMTLNGLDIFTVENTDMHATLYTPEAEIFLRFALRWATYWVIPLLFMTSAPKWSQITWTCSKSKCQDASFVSLYNEPFLSKGLILGKCPPKRPWHIQSKNYQYACISLLGPNFRPFWSTINCFRGTSQHCESAPNDHKIPCWRLKVPICIQNKPQRPKFSSVCCTMSCFRVTP